jgi:hypothetical protein
VVRDMLKETTKDELTVTFMSHCPECSRVRPVSLNRSGLLEKLASAEDIKVLNGVCGHEWNLSRQEKENVHQKLAEVSL